MPTSTCTLEGLTETGAIRMLLRRVGTAVAVDGDGCRIFGVRGPVGQAGGLESPLVCGFDHDVLEDE